MCMQAPKVLVIWKDLIANKCLVFPPVQKRGMVKFPGNGHFLSAQQQAKGALLNLRRQAKRALLSPSLKLNVVLSYINLCPLA